jgi:hypothetical protein
MLSANSFFDGAAMRALAHVRFGGADFGECMVTMRRVPPGDMAAWYREWTVTATAIPSA